MHTILVIEDNTDILENMVDYFEMEGYRVLFADNGCAGVELAEKYNPDIIICDFFMPGKNGYEVLHDLMNLEKTCCIPVIFSTSLPQNMDRSEVLELGADDYIVKPYEPEALLKMTEKCLKYGSKRKDASDAGAKAVNQLA